jgi:hypothetical protein
MATHDPIVSVCTPTFDKTHVQIEQLTIEELERLTSALAVDVEPYESSLRKAMSVFVSAIVMREHIPTRAKYAELCDKIAKTGRHFVSLFREPTDWPLDPNACPPPQRHIANLLFMIMSGNPPLEQTLNDVSRIVHLCADAYKSEIADRPKSLAAGPVTDQPFNDFLARILQIANLASGPDRKVVKFVRAALAITVHKGEAGIAKITLEQPFRRDALLRLRGYGNKTPHVLAENLRPLRSPTSQGV